MISNKKLTRSTQDKVIAGVCAGLAEFLEIDVTVVRLVFVILTIFGGGGLLIYFIMWILVPLKTESKNSTKKIVESNAQEIKNTAQEWIDKTGLKTNPDRNPLGLILVIIGGYFLLFNLGWLDWLDFGRLWPVLLIVLGIMVLKRK